MGKEIEIEGKLNADIDANIVEGRPEKISATAILAGFSQKIDGKAVVLDEPVTLDVDISSDGDDVKIDKLRLKSSFCSISGKGGMNSFDYIAAADIAKTMDIVGQFVDLGGYTFAGKGTEQGRILFDKGNVWCKGATMVDGFVVGAPDGKVTPVTSAKISFDLGYDAEKNLVDIANFAIDSAKGPGKVAILDTVIPLGEEKKGMDVKIEVDLDIGKTMDYARVFGAAKEGLAVAGNVKSAVSISEGKDGWRFLSDKTIITNLVISGDKTAEPFKDPKIVVQFDAVLDFEEKTYDIPKLVINASQVDIKGRMKQTHAGGQTKLGGKVDASYDLAELGKAGSAYLPKGFNIEGKRVDTIEFSSVYPKGEDDKMLANMNANATLGFSKAEYMGLRFGKTEAKVLVKNGIAEIAPFSTVVNEGKFNFAGRLDLQKKPMVFEIPGEMQVIEKINIDERMAKQMLQYLNPVFADQANLSGVADLHCEKLSIPLGGDADISQAEIRGTVAMSNMRMQPVGPLGGFLSLAKGKAENKAELLPTKFVLAKGKLSYEDMQLNVDDHPLNFVDAIIHLGAEPLRYNMIAKLPYEMVFDGYNPKFETITVGDGHEDSEDRISFPYNEKTNIEKMFGEILKKAAEQLLKKIPEDILKDQLKDIFKSKNGGGEKSVEEEIGEIFEGLFK
ncbi:MAG: hypothetical protein FVQ79_10575 [Planctomycetes bacterium]|nr:hypothetical protein [Planctomycetota bacterium]